MKTKFLLVIVFVLFVSNAYSQLEVNPDGSITVSQFKVNNILSGSTGDASNSNVSFGYKALSNPSAIQNYNVAFGIGALSSNTSGFANTAHGGEALHLNTGGFFNTANGYRALYSNTTGTGNTAQGERALCNNTEGGNNTATGNCSLANNTTGTWNSGHGLYALYYNTTGNSNTAHGNQSLPDNTTGCYNTACGAWSLRDNTTGSFNTSVGAYTYFLGGNLSNTTAIGSDVWVTSSNQVRIGSTSVSEIGGYSNWTNFSDGRAKKNIRTNVPGLSFIKGLQPVTYNLDLDAIDDLLKAGRKEGEENAPALSKELLEVQRKAREAKEKQVQTGFVAQDVEKTAKSLGYNFSGVDVDESGIYGLRYAEFVVPLVKAVQELSEQNDRLSEKNDQLQKQINELTGLVNKLLVKKDDPGIVKDVETNSLK